MIVIWLLALATKLLENPQENKLPRRLVYVVDRRVIVDQATKEAEKVLKRLRALKRLSAMKKTHGDLRQIFDVLKSISFLEDDKNIIALSTLRGEFADNREWMLDPSRPAIIVGTIDMIGSRLLFSAYGGVGESYKALQAGLLGQDALIVIDEAHLSPAFMQTLRAVNPKVNRKDLIKPFFVMSLSATPAVEEGESFEPFTLETDAPEDLTDEVAAPRLNAEKKIEWKSFPVGEDILKSKKAAELLRNEQAKEMASVAAQYKDLSVSVLVFGATVDLVKKIKDELITTQGVDKDQVLLMVGGMRGYERDKLVENPVFQMFAPKPKRPPQDKSYFLVATSCAEVGVNLDADFAVCDLTSADSFVQRLGRVNRFGESSSVVTVVFSEDLSLQTEQAIETLKTLRQSENGNGLNASPLILREIEFSENCYPPKPVCPPLDSARIDDWSMTSLKQDKFPRPLVSYWLRGVTEDKRAETSLCWRADLSLANTDKRKIATVKTVRVKSRECARESTNRAEATIKAIAEKFPEQRVVIITSGGDYKVRSLEELKDNPDLYAELMFATVVLPCEVGGLENGIAVDALPKDVTPVPDVVDADEWLRVLLTETEDGVNAEIINGESKFYDDAEKIEDATRPIAQSENKRCVKQIVIKSAAESEDDGEEEKPKRQVLAYFINRKSPERFLPSEGEMDDETASLAFGQVELERHNADVSDFAKRLAAKLYLSAEFAEALEIAGRWHDKGKARECWQKAVGNFDYPEKILAKSNQTWFNHKFNDYYRHEFGSLVEAEESEELNGHPSRDLILHLIATHHGYARPHFPARAFDKDNPTPLNQETAERAMLRFARLQTEYGWWQLAYLEAILKAADALASRAEARGEV